MNLTDLTLSNNAIVTLENVGELKELVFLSVNNNRLSNLGDTIRNIKSLPKLQVLNLVGNKFDQKNYHEFLIFHLKDTLKYIDSKFIDSNMITVAGSHEDRYKLPELDEKPDDSNKKKDELAIKEYEDLKLTLLYKYDEKLLESNAELGVYLENEKIFEASRTQFREVMKTRCAALLSALKIKIDDKNAKIQLYLKMRKYNEERAEKDILALLEDYFKRKKKAKLIWEDDKRKSLSEREAAVNDLLRWMNTDLDRMLMTVETNAFNDAIVSIFSYAETPQYPQEGN